MTGLLLLPGEPPVPRPSEESAVVSRLISFGPGAVEPLLQLLPTLPVPRAQLAVRSLGGLGQPCAVAVLGRLTEQDLPGLSGAAAEALVVLAHPAGLRWAARYAGRPGPPPRRSVVSRLAELGERYPASRQTVIPLLAWLAAPARPPAIRTAAIEGLGRLPDPAVASLLARELDRDADPLVRHQAAEGLIGRRDPEALRAAARALRDDYGPVVAAAATALGASGAPDQAVPPLLEALQRPRREGRDPVIQALARLGDRRAIPALLRALDEPDPYLQASVIGALTALGDADQSGAAVRAALRSPHPTVRLAAATGLADLGLRAALPELLELARRDEHPGVRAAAQSAALRLQAAR